jgi:HD superfamily phosphohydrolase
MKKFDGGRTMRTNDDVHVSVSMCPLFQTIVDTPQVQRLAGLKQLGVSEMVYRNVTHNRLEHSLGVAHLAESMARALQRKQPNLKITGKEIICIKLAGLCHDLGHGPFSHAYEVFRKIVKKRRELEEKCSSAESTLDDGWKHEDASLMMIDALLKHHGMAIDMDHLDEPLKQIGNGIDAKQLFAEYDLPMEELSKPDNVLTSRDWVFIKECVLGAPLPKAGETIKQSTSIE